MRHINKFTLKELNKVGDLLPDNWQDELNFTIVNKKNVSKNSIELGNNLTIKVENYIINQPPNFFLSEQWNNNTVPPEEILDIEIIQILEKMVKVKAVGKCTKISWEGWLPRKSFKVL